MQVDRDGNYMKDEGAYGADPKSEVEKVDEEVLRQQVWEALGELSDDELRVLYGLEVTREVLVGMIVHAISHADGA